jgi:hypothetical protein
LSGDPRAEDLERHWYGTSKGRVPFTPILLSLGCFALPLKLTIIGIFPCCLSSSCLAPEAGPSVMSPSRVSDRARSRTGRYADLDIAIQRRLFYFVGIWFLLGPRNRESIPTLSVCCLVCLSRSLFCPIVVESFKGVGRVEQGQGLVPYCMQHQSGIVVPFTILLAVPSIRITILLQCHIRIIQIAVCPFCMPAIYLRESDGG